MVTADARVLGRIYEYSTWYYHGGYKISDAPQQPSLGRRFNLRDSNGDNITIEFGQCTMCPDGKLFGLLRAGFRSPKVSSAPGCPQEHLKTWHFRDGIVSRTFEMKRQGIAIPTLLRLSLSLEHPFSAATKSFILDIQILAESTALTPSPSTPRVNSEPVGISDLPIQPPYTNGLHLVAPTPVRPSGHGVDLQDRARPFSAPPGHRSDSRVASSGPDERPSSSRPRPTVQTSGSK